MEIEVSTEIERAVATVWEFYAVNHIENHPRWDPSLELEATSDGPIEVGTVIRRRATRLGNTTDGTMEVIEFEPEASMRFKTQDGPMTINGWVLFESVGEDATRIILGGEFPGMDESIGKNIRQMMQQSALNIKTHIESETCSPSDPC